MDVQQVAAALTAEIRAEAAAQQISTTDLAAHADISRPSAYRYLTGERDIPVPVLLNLARVLRVSPGRLFDRAELRARNHAPHIGDAEQE